MELFDVRVDALPEARRAFASRFIAECDRSGGSFEGRYRRANLALGSLPAIVLADVRRELARWLELRLKNMGATFELLPKGIRWIAIDPHHPARGDQPFELIDGDDTVLGRVLVENEREAISRLSATHPELEAQLAEAESEEGLKVYADWLLEQGDVRGELMAIQLSQDRAQLEHRERELFEAHRRHLLGPLVNWPQLELRWRAGMIDEVQVVLHGRDQPVLEGDLLVESLSDLLALPAARLLRGLSCLHGYPVGVAHVLAELGPPRSLRRLTLGPNNWFDQRSGPTTGPVAALLRKTEGLEELSLTSLDFDLDRVELPHLRKLRLIGAMVESTLNAIGEAEWPALERMELWFETSNEHWVPAYPPPAASFFAVLTAELPRLRHLVIKGAPDPNALCEILVEAPFLAQLETLDLSESALDDRGAASLTAHHQALANLQVLDLRRTKIRDETARLMSRFGARLLT